MGSRSPVSDFIVRRAFRRGSVTRSELMNVFDLSAATASRAMKSAVTEYGDLLARAGQGLRPKPVTEPPPWADESDLLDNLDRGRSEPQHTGLFEGELPVVYVSWSARAPRRPGILRTIVQAITNESSVRLAHVGLRKMEQVRERWVAPLALERMNDQWRVIAQDLDKPGFPIRVFVLSRILDAQPDGRRKPNGFVRRGHTDHFSRIRVKLNPALTSIQRDVLERELQIVDGRVSVASRSAFEFLQRFSNQPPNPDAVWPPIVSYEVE
jgi:hypothetical protein